MVCGNAGSMMSFAWGVLAPIGIMLALYYKIVWPNGQWFYVRKSNAYNIHAYYTSVFVCRLI